MLPYPIHPLILPAALTLDLILGDPRRLPHPVRWMGRAIAGLEPVFRRLPLPLFHAGALYALSLVALTWGATATLLGAVYSLDPTAGLMVETLLIFYSLSLRSLIDAAHAVYQPLRKGDLAAARKRLSEIVGRDVAGLDTAAISRATVETVSENFVDGVLSPLFFSALGGAPLAMAFKMVNTLDSMVGYRNERYLYFGRAAARLDDMANYIPARLALPVIALGAALLGGDARRTWMTALKEGRRHLSPNSGYPEAAFAGALGIWLGGPNLYEGRLVVKPVIGEGLCTALPAEIPRACTLVLISALLGLVLVCSLTLLWALAG